MLLAACSSASRLRAWHKIDYRKKRKADKTARPASVNSSMPGGGDVSRFNQPSGRCRAAGDRYDGCAK